MNTALTLFAIGLAVGTIHAAPLTQSLTNVDANGNAYIAWEAESFASTTVGTPTQTAWESTADGSAFGGQAILANTGTDTSNSDGTNYATYDLVFVTAGTYSLYWSGRANATPAGSNDGWFAPDGGFGDTTPSRRVNGFRDDDLNRLGGTNPSSDNYSTSYQWFRQGGDTNARIDFNVTADNVTNGDVLSVNIGTREDGLLIDRWILSENTNLFGSTAGDTAPELDAFTSAIPEPSTLFLVGIAFGSLFLKHTRRK